MKYVNNMTDIAHFVVFHKNLNLNTFLKPTPKIHKTDCTGFHTKLPIAYNLYFVHCGFHFRRHVAKLCSRVFNNRWFSPEMKVLSSQVSDDLFATVTEAFDV